MEEVDVVGFKVGCGGVVEYGDMVVLGEEVFYEVVVEEVGVVGDECVIIF